MSNDSSYVDEVQGFTLMRYLYAAGFTLLCYDSLLTQADEIHLVWAGTFSLPKALYYMNRYLSIIAMSIATYATLAGLRPPLSTSFCKFNFWLAGIVIALRYTAATGTLTLRLVVLYRGVRWVIRPLWVAFAICHGFRITLISVISVIAALKVAYDPTLDQCFPGDLGVLNSRVVPIMLLVVPTTFDLGLLVLTIVKASRSRTFLESHPSSPIMRTLVRDELLYFFGILIMRVINAIFWFTSLDSVKVAALVLEWGLEASCISRFFLNLRSIHYSTNPIVASGSLPSVVQTHFLWKQRVTTGFSAAIEEDARGNNTLGSRNDRGDPHAQTVDLDAAIELQTRHNEEEGDVKLIADFTPKGEK